MFDLAQIIRQGGGAAAIARELEEAIGEGTVQAGAKLPTVRELASMLHVSPATVAAAYRTLRDRGLVTGDGRRGTHVSGEPPLRTRPATPLPAGVRDLARGNPDPLLLPPLAPILKRLDTAHVLYGEPAMLPALEEIARDRFARDSVAGPIAITSGALDGIERALTAQLRPGDAVILEDPTWPRITDLVRALGLRPEPVAIDERGFLPEALDRALRGRPQALIATPRGQNPAGAALDDERGAELRALLAGYPALLVIEDDYVAEIAGTPYVPLHGTTERWVVVRSLSKSHGPDLRVALLAGDVVTVQRIGGRQLLGAGWVSHLLQHAAALLLQSSATARLLARASRTYTERRDALVAELGSRGVEAQGRSGLGVWIPVDDETETAQLLLGRGWAVSTGERYRFSSPPGIRVTTATLTPKDAARLADAIQQTTASRFATYSG